MSGRDRSNVPPPLNRPRTSQPPNTLQPVSEAHHPPLAMAVIITTTIATPNNPSNNPHPQPNTQPPCPLRTTLRSLQKPRLRRTACSCGHRYAVRRRSGRFEGSAWCCFRYICREGASERRGMRRGGRTYKGNYPPSGQPLQQTPTATPHLAGRSKGIPSEGGRVTGK
jgi:hypothetical protein